jgi:hypothetical protein
MYVNVGHVHHSIEREKKNVHALSNTAGPTLRPNRQPSDASLLSYLHRINIRTLQRSTRHRRFGLRGAVLEAASIWAPFCGVDRLRLARSCCPADNCPTPPRPALARGEMVEHGTYADAGTY